MKTKNFKKKLTLNKTTIAHLKNSGMRELKGGEPTTPIHPKTGATLTCIVCACMSETDCVTYCCPPTQVGCTEEIC
jgi:hypothetical protein